MGCFSRADARSSLLEQYLRGYLQHSHSDDKDGVVVYVPADICASQKESKLVGHDHRHDSELSLLHYPVLHQNLYLRPPGCDMVSIHFPQVLRGQPGSLVVYHKWLEHCLRSCHSLPACVLLAWATDRQTEKDWDNRCIHGGSNVSICTLKGRSAY